MISRRKHAALQAGWDYLTNRRWSFRRVFKLETPDGQTVIMELARFCHINEGVWDESQRRTDVLIGRQEVYQFIMQHLKLTPEQHFELANGKMIQVVSTEEAEGEE